MPRLQNIRREQFANLMAEGVNQSVAYERAGYSGNSSGGASNLKRQPEVAARIDELREVARRRHRVTVDTLTDEYEEARTIARTVEQPGAMVQATTGKAKLHGLDKSDQTNIDNRTINVMGDVELARRMTMLLQRGVNALDEPMPPEQREHLNAHLRDPDIV